MIALGIAMLAVPAYASQSDQLNQVEDWCEVGFKVDNQDLNGVTEFDLGNGYTLRVNHQVIDDTLEEINFLVTPNDPPVIGVTKVVVKASTENTVVRVYDPPETDDEIEWAFQDHEISHFILCIAAITTTTTTFVDSTTSTSLGSTTTTSTGSPTTTLGTTSSSVGSVTSSTNSPTDPVLPFTGGPGAGFLAVVGAMLIGVGYATLRGSRLTR